MVFRFHLPAWGQHFQHEPVVLDSRGDGAAVFLGGVADALQAETVVGWILLGRRRQAVPEIRMERAVIFDLQQQELLLGAEYQPDDPFGLVRDLQLALDGVVQRVAEYRADIRHVHERQQLAVGHHQQLNALVLAIQALSRQDRIQHPVSGLVLDLIGLDILLHGLQPLLPDLGVRLGAKSCDQVLDVVVLPVYHFNGLPAQQILGVLALQDGLKGRQLLLGLGLHPLDVEGHQHRDAREIHQGADVHDVAGIDAAEGIPPVIEAQIAHGEAQHTDDHDDDQLPCCNGELTLG